MQTAPRPDRVSIAAPAGDKLMRPAGPGARAGLHDAQFVDLLNAYRHSGGLARSGEVSATLGRHGAGGIAMLARWIVRGEVVHFDWQAETWLPMFQWGGAGVQPHPAVSRVIGELAAVMPPLALAQWFARPNAALAGQRPADALKLDPGGVWQTARADRYLIDG